MKVRVIMAMIRKEFVQFFRDPANIRMLIVMPVVQLLLLPLAADYEVKSVRVCIVDSDHSPLSHELTAKIAANSHMHVGCKAESFEQALEGMERDEIDIALLIPAHFERDLVRNQNPVLSASVHAVNGQRASVGSQYLLQILADFNNKVRMNWLQLPKFNPVPLVDITHTYLYNPRMDYPSYMVPGILVILLTMVGFSLASMNLVREKEIGTIEQINVSPVRKSEFILGKLIPFWILGLVVLTLGLGIAAVFYGIYPRGSVGTIYAFASLYLFAILGLALLLSAFAQTQQQVMLVSYFVMMIFILLSGLYTSVESMPPWAQMTTHLNPVAHFIVVIRMVVLKGSTLSDILPHVGAMAAMAGILLPLAIWSYRKHF